MPFTPIQFSLIGPAPLTAQRAQSGYRLEQAQGYLSPDDLGFNSVTVPAQSDTGTPLIWSPGFSAFTINLASDDTAGGNISVYIVLRDPLTQALLYDDVNFNGPVALSTAPTGGGQFAFGAVLNTNLVGLSSGFVWILWNLHISNSDFFDHTVTLEIFGDSRRGILS